MAEYKILTALHSVVESRVPDAGVFCKIRLAGDRQSLEGSDNVNWKWCEARLIWPKPGQSVPDLAVVEVLERDRSEIMKNPPELLSGVSNSSTSRLIGRAIGYPKWKEGRHHAARGPIDFEETIPGLPNEFDVEGATPDSATGWEGMSGAVLFQDNTNIVLGIVTKRESSKANSLLGATLFRAVANDDTFWSAAGLPRPSTTASRQNSRRSDQKTAKPSNFLHLFDRDPQQISVGYHVEKKLTMPPYPVVLIAIIAAAEDEASYLVRRLELILESKFTERKNCYHNTDVIPWLSDDLSPASVLADQMLYEFKNQLRVKISYELLTDTSTVKEMLESGTTARAFRVEVKLDDSRAEDILKGIFDTIASIGKLDTPLVFFLTIDRTILSLDGNKPTDNPLFKRLTILGGSHPDEIAWLPLQPLGLCTEEHLDQWEAKLRQMAEPKVGLESYSSYEVLKEINGGRENFDISFPLRKAKYALAKLGL